MRGMLIAAASMLALAPSPALAHHFWLVPSDGVQRVKPGASIPMVLQVGEALRSDEERAFESARIGSITHLRAKGPVLDLRPAAREGKSPLAVVKADSAGGHLLAVEVTPLFIEIDGEKFTRYLTVEGLVGPLLERQSAGQSAAPGRERYSRSLKALLRAGDAKDDVFGRVLGTPLEIVPGADPSLAKPGDTIPVRVLFRGKPLAGAMLVVSAGGEKDPKKVRTFALTDAAGSANVAVTRGGTWLLTAVQMTRCPLPCPVGADGAEWESFWASYTFGVATP